MAEDGRQICCCGAATWARIIAWLQIIFNALSAVLIILALVGINVDRASGGPRPEGTVLVVMLFSIAVCVLGLIFGVILLRGVNQKKPRLLQIWMIFSIICLMLTILGIIFGSDETIFMKIGRCLLNVILYGFGIWIVNSLKRDYENEQGSSHV